MCAHHSTQLSYTIQYGVVLLIFRLILHTFIIAQMLSAGARHH